jgi:fibronectin type 3 domain-containing protein
MKSVQGGKKPKIDYSLEEFNFKSLNSLSLNNSIAFEWRKAKSIRVKGYIIYRGSIDAKKMNAIAIIRDRYITSFVDTKLKAKTTYLYKFTVLGENDIEAPHSPVKPFSTRDFLPSVSYINGISNLPTKAKIIWRPHKNSIVNSYDIYRKAPKDKGFTKITNIPFNLSSSFIDSKVQDNAEYSYFVVGRTYDGGNTKSSKIVKVKTKNTPIGISNLRSTKNLPRKIDLSWSYKSTDVSGYRIYVSDNLNKSFRFLSFSKNKSFSHKVGNGVGKYYKVTAIDKDELESSLKLSMTILGQSLPIPPTPVLEEYVLDINNHGISLRWTKHHRFKTFDVIRNNKRIDTIKENVFLDVNIVGGNIYRYEIIAIDKYAIRSKPSIKVEVRLPKTTKSK